MSRLFIYSCTIDTPKLYKTTFGWRGCDTREQAMGMIVDHIKQTYDGWCIKNLEVAEIPASKLMTIIGVDWAAPGQNDKTAIVRVERPEKDDDEPHWLFRELLIPIIEERKKSAEPD